MKGERLGKTNHLAVVGFLLPFAAAGLTALMMLVAREDFMSLRVSLFYLVIVPLILLSGAILSLKSIPMIPEKGDRDYAYSGLTMNILFFFFYIISLICFFSDHFG